MEQILHNLYRIAIPLPGSPLKELSCYLIRSDKRNLLIDCGFNQDVCEEAMLKGLAELGVSLDNTDIFLTHLHADHAGLCGRLKRPENHVYIRASEGARVNRFLLPEYWDGMMAFEPPMGVPTAEWMDFHNHPAYRNRIDKPVDFTDVQPGWRITVGGYRLEAVDLAGHTPGQLGLWDAEKGILFSGDHILAKITPNICIWDFDNDYLAIYLKNLRKVRKMGVTKLLSAHRQPVENVEKRVDELLLHHAARCDEICSLCKQGGKTVWQIAHGMAWDFGAGCFADFPPNQKWFGSLEVFAHAEHLRRVGRLSCEKRPDGWIYTNE